MTVDNSPWARAQLRFLPLIHELRALDPTLRLDVDTTGGNVHCLFIRASSDTLARPFRLSPPDRCIVISDEWDDTEGSGAALVGLYLDWDAESDGDDLMYLSTTIQTRLHHGNEKRLVDWLAPLIAGWLVHPYTP